MDRILRLKKSKIQRNKMEKDLYIMTICGGVDPTITGPFRNEEKRQVAFRAIRKEYGEESSHYPVDMTVGASFEIGNF